MRKGPTQIVHCFHSSPLFSKTNPNDTRFCQPLEVSCKKKGYENTAKEYPKRSSLGQKQEKHRSLIGRHFSALPRDKASSEGCLHHGRFLLNLSILGCRTAVVTVVWMIGVFRWLWIQKRKPQETAGFVPLKFPFPKPG